MTKDVKRVRAAVELAVWAVIVAAPIVFWAWAWAEGWGR